MQKHKGDGGAAEGDTHSAAPDPTASKELCLDDVQGHVHTTQRVTIWDHQYSWQHRCLRALHVGPHAC